ncbi:hypothetical protein C8Q76DRAFT_212818 [Earliella scabrosa]|nr:hypothetical protein C8Q76DRAFT_212818 [Earliella scabrosa]
MFRRVACNAYHGGSRVLLHDGRLRTNNVGQPPAICTATNVPAMPPGPGNAVDGCILPYLWANRSEEDPPNGTFRDFVPLHDAFAMRIKARSRALGTRHAEGPRCLLTRAHSFVGPDSDSISRIRD